MSQTVPSTISQILELCLNTKVNKKT